MRNVWLICKRELASFFFSPVAYVVLAAWAFLMGVFFSGSFFQYALISMQLARNPQAAAQMNITPTSVVLEPVFASVSVVLLFLTPILTMRLFSEEKKLGTIELLLTYPLRDGHLLAGKFLSVLLLYLLMLALTLIYPVIVSLHATVEWPVVASSYLGVFLLGSAFLSVGIMASSWTSNQIIAATAAFMILLLSFILDFLASSAGPTLAAVLRHLSIGLHLRNAIRGIIDTRDVIYLVNINILCLFLAMRSLEYYRWRA